MWAGGTGRAAQFMMEEDGSDQVGAPPGISLVTASGCGSRARAGECLPDSAKKKKPLLVRLSAKEQCFFLTLNRLSHCPQNANRNPR